jgi:tight adherence protein B
MSPLRSLLASTALAVGAVLAGAPAATADDASIAHVETTETGLQILVSVPAGAEVDLDKITVKIAGADAPAVAELAGTSTSVRRTAVLAIDTSNSMKGDRFGSAKQAAMQFLKAVPDDVYVGIVAFAGAVTEPLPPTLDRARARQVVKDLALSRQTRLYDGVLAAVDMAGTEGQRTLLVLSDGADTSDTELDSTTASIEAAGVLLDVVALDQADKNLEALQALADAGNGQLINAERTALAQTFNDEAELLARQVLVTAQTPASVTDTEATVVVTLPTATGTLTAQAFTTIQSAGGPPAPTPIDATSQQTGGGTPAWVMYAGVGAFGVGLLLVLLLLVPRASPATLSPAERVDKYTATQKQSHGPVPPRIDTDQALSSATGAMEGLLRRNVGLEARISKRLEAAGSELRAPEWLLLHAAILVGAGLLGALIGGGNLLLGLLFIVAGAVVPWLYLGRMRNKRRKAFNAGLPDSLQLMAGSLAAGLSLAQSVDTIVREGVEPIASEFKRVLIEARLGVTLEDALDGVAVRFESRDFEWAVMAIRIQRQVGGNLAELLETVAATMREREYVRRQVAALAAEGKLSAIVLGALPPMFLLYLALTQRDFVAPLFTDPRGWVMLGFGTAWLGVGIFWMSKLIKVEV